MICEHCNTKIPEGSRFCPVCGVKLIEPPISKKNATLTGQTLADKYMVVKRIGSGAMGNIYKAAHIDLGKTMVIKVLHEHLVSDDTQVKRFKREAKAASMLNHPNIVQVYDFGHTPDGLAYIVMEFIEGEDLRQILFTEGSLSEKRTIDISIQMFSALAEAHSAGIIHRDIKPENIMVSMAIIGEEVAKVLDFGIAKLQDMADGGSIAFKTATGTVFGTPEYMSPEQITGKKLDLRTDLYSCGITMFEMLTGKLPFEGSSLLEIASQQIHKPIPSIRKLRPEISEDLEKLIIKLLAKKPDDRVSSAVDAYEMLLEIRKKQRISSFITNEQQKPATLDKILEAEEPEKTTKPTKPEKTSEPSKPATTEETEESEEGATMMIDDSDFVQKIQKKMQQAQVEKRQEVFAPQGNESKATEKHSKEQTNNAQLYLWIGLIIISLGIIAAIIYILIN